MPREVVERVLDAAGDLVLVGGQALGVWMDRYDISMPGGLSYVSRDVDFLAESAGAVEHVRRLARALGGRAEIPKRRAGVTALVGQAVRETSDEEYLNVDVIHRVFGADARVRSRAVTVVRGDGLRFRVLHPLDVLKSRLDNLHGLAEKQNELGVAQLRAAIAVAQAFQRDVAKEKRSGSRRSEALRYVTFISRLASDDAGKKVARRWGIHIADALEPSAVPGREFREKQLPRLAHLMSAERRGELGLVI